MQQRIPLLVFGDGPRLSTGLARIARDLTSRLVANADDLGIAVGQIGVDEPDGWHWQPWEFFGFQPRPDEQGWGVCKHVELELAARFPGVRPILLTIMDASRIYDLTRWHGIGDEDPDDAHLQMDLWSYFPVDGHNAQERIGGPAAEAVSKVSRVLAYGRYGAGVLRRTLEWRQPKFRVLPPAQVPAVSYLPHGIEPTFRPHVPLSAADSQFQSWAESQPAGALRIGCVATNQPRKDLGLLIASVAELKARGHAVALWLHTDLLTRAWDIGELVTSFALRQSEVAVSTATLTDEELSAQYCWSQVTFAPGAGEGFGYPIVESLACGTPVVHGNYAGGVELIPTSRWVVEPVAWRLESIYAVLRPVYKPSDVADALLCAIRDAEDPACTAYCAGAVAHLSWEHLWPRWRSWINQGLTLHRGRQHSETLHVG